MDLRLAPAALAAWAVTAAVICWPIGPELAALAFAVAVVAVVVRIRGGRRAAAIATGVAAVAVVAGGFAVAVTLRADTVAAHPLTTRVGQTAQVLVVPSESPRQTGSGRVVFPATLRELDGAQSSGRVTVFAKPGQFDDLGVGQPAAFSARVGTPTRRDLTVAVLTAVGEPKLGRAPPAQRVAQRVRDRFGAASHAVLPGDTGDVLPGLILGDTSAVTPAVGQSFRASGLTHLMAVSGANVTIVCGAVLLAAGLAGPRIAVTAAAVALAGFVLIVQPSASVLRAAVMGAIGLAAVLSARRRQGVPALAAAVLVLLVIAPQLAVDLGFALSTVATAALIVIAPMWSARLQARGWPKPLADATAVCAAAQLATAPLVAAAMGYFSTVAVLANLLAGLAVAPITVLGTLAAALTGLCPPVAELLIRFAGPLLWWVLEVAQRAAAIPGASTPLPSGFAGFALVAGLTAAGMAAWRWSWGRRLIGAAVLTVAAWTLAGWL